MIYLDSAATTLQKPPEVARAVAYAIDHLASPGRGGHGPAMAAAETAFACRELAAELFQVSDPEHVVFTFNATHGLNLAIHSLLKPGDTVLISGYEHNAVTRPLHAMDGIQVKVAQSPLFDQTGAIQAFQRAMTPEVKAVICNHVSNVFGFCLPLEEIGMLCQERGIPLIVDASQSAGCVPIAFEQLGAKFVAMPGHKGLYGPQGTGLLLCQEGTKPLLYGGTGSASLQQAMPDFLPDRLEAGTHNVAGIAGLLEGMRFVKRRGIESILEEERGLVGRMGELLSALPGVQLYWAPRETCVQTGVLSFRVEGWDCEELGEALGRRGISLRAGYHCAPLAHRTGGTLDTGTIRASVSPWNTMGEMERWVGILRQLLQSESRTYSNETRWR